MQRLLNWQNVWRPSGQPTTALIPVRVFILLHSPYSENPPCAMNNPPHTLLTRYATVTATRETNFDFIPIAMCGRAIFHDNAHTTTHTPHKCPQHRHNTSTTHRQHNRNGVHKTANVLWRRCWVWDARTRAHECRCHQQPAHTHIY